MKELLIIGQSIKEKRLLLNMRMDDLAKKAEITRATLSSIEKGTSNCSIVSLLKIVNILGISFSIDNHINRSKRIRATRINTCHDKKVNKFIIMCVEQYAYVSGKNSGNVYKEMLAKGIIEDLTNDYEDLHGMSFTYLNDYINSFLSYELSQSKNANHLLAKAILIVEVVELISNKYRLHIKEARNQLYSSDFVDLIDDDETGLYGESPLYVFSLYEKEATKGK